MTTTTPVLTKSTSSNFKFKNNSTKTYPINTTDKSTSPARTTSFEQVITVKNSKKTAVERLIVRDQVPVSEDDKVKVRVKKPIELATSETTAEPVVLHSRTTSLKGASLKITTSQKDKEKKKENGAEAIRPQDSITGSVREVQPVAGVTIRPRWIPSFPLGTSQSLGDSNALTLSISQDSLNAIDSGLPTTEAGGSENGMLEWVCSLDAGASAELVLAWEVTAPVSVEWE